MLSRVWRRSACAIALAFSHPLAHAQPPAAPAPTTPSFLVAPPQSRQLAPTPPSLPAQHVAPTVARPFVAPAAHLARYQAASGAALQPPTPPPAGGSLPEPPSPSKKPDQDANKPEAIPKPRGMTLAELEQLALANNPSLVQEGAAIGSAQGDWLQVGLYPNPDVAYAGNQMGDRGTAGQQGMWVAQTFVTAHKLRLNRAVVSQDVNRTQQQLFMQRWRVVSDVRLRYYDAVVAQRALDVTANLLRISQQGLVAADALLKAQEASRVDLLQAQIERDTALILQTRAQNRHRAAWQALSAVCGVPTLGPAPLEDTLLQQWPELNWDDSLGMILANSPELGAARAQVARASWTLQRALVEPIPNLDTQFSPQYDTNARYPNYTVLASIKVPLFNKNQGNIRAAQADIAAARANVAKLELALQQRLSMAFERYANARQQSERYTRDIMPNAQKTLELVTQGYRQGEFTYLFLLTAQRTFSQVNLSYIDSLRELWQSAAIIDGMLLSDSLDSGMGESPAPNLGPGAPPGANPTLTPTANP